jgi:transposase
VTPPSFLQSDSDPAVIAIIAQLQQQLDAQTRELDYARLKIQVLEERLRKQRIEKYGKRSETLSDLQLELLDLEPGVSSEEVETESQREPLVAPAEDKPQEQPNNKPRRKHPGRNELPSHLKRVDEPICCTAEQCICGQCGKQTSVIGYEETEVLDVRPAEYSVRVIKREKRACRQCEVQGVQTAAAPERILPKSVLSDNVIIDLIVSKYCDAKPIYRQQATMRRDAGIELALSTLDDAVINAGELLIPIAAAMKRELLAGTYIQADETPVGVQTHEKRGRNHQSYLWQYGSPGKTGSPRTGLRPWGVEVRSSISAWAAIARGPGCSSETSRDCSRLMDIRSTTRSEDRGSFMRRVLHMRAENTLTQSRSTRRTPSRRALSRSWMSCSRSTVRRERNR